MGKIKKGSFLKLFMELCALAAVLVLSIYWIHHYFDSLSKLPPRTAVIIWPHINKNVIDLAKRSYVQVSSENWSGSGVQVSPTLAITCFHVLNPGDTARARGDALDSQSMGFSTKDDIFFFRTKPQDTPAIPIAQHVTTGEILIGVSHGGGNDGIMRYYWAAYLTEDTLMVGQFGTPTIKGESGSGLFNLRGELVGIMKGYEMYYGVATPFNRIAALKAKIDTPPAP